MGRRWWNLRSHSFFAQALILVVFEAILFAAAAPLALYLHPAAGIIAAVLAAGVCLASALLALWMHHLFPDPQSVLTSTLLGMAFNMVIPFAFGIGIHLHGGSLSAAGFLYYLLFFYLPTLAVKTILTVSRSQHTAAENNFS